MTSFSGIITPRLIMIGSMMNAATSRRFKTLLDPAQRLRVERRGDLAAVRQQVLDALAIVGRADAQPGKRVAVVAVFERQKCAAACVDSAPPAARGRRPQIHRSRGSRSSAVGAPARRAAAPTPSTGVRITGIDVIGPLEAFDGFRDCRGPPPEIPDAPAHHKVDGTSCRASQ